MQRIVFGVTLLTAGFLWGRSSASLWYISAVLLHFVVGLGLAWYWTKEGMRHIRMRTVWPIAAGISYLVASASGIAIAFTGTVPPYGWVLSVHIVFSVLSLASFLIDLAALPTWNLRIKSGWILAAFVLLLALNQIDYDGQYRIENEVPGPVSLAENTPGGEESPFFPSQATTKDGNLIDSEFFLDSSGCGRSGCHVDAVEQWSASAHHFSSFNNQWYRKSIEYMTEVAGVERPKWCAGCHDPALLFAGKMGQPVSSFLDDPAAHAGLACVACHTIQTVRNTGGNGAYVIEFPSMHYIATHENPIIRFVHDRLIKMDPAPHRSTFLKPFMVEDQAAFCSSCHKVHLDKAVNDYRWLRGFNTYDNWQASGVSGQGARSFYQPDAPLQCTNCHMQPTPSTDPGSDDGHMLNHRFIAANTALPVANQDTTQLEMTLDFLQNGHLSVDIFAVSELTGIKVDSEENDVTDNLALSTSFAVGEEQGMTLRGRSGRAALNLIGGLVNEQAVLEPGKKYRLDVVVRSKSIGHFFPTGTTDAQEAWLEVEVKDAHGEVVLHSGKMQNGVVDSTAHFYRSLLIDGNSRRIDKRNAFAARSAVYVNLIPPGGADVAHFALDPTGQESGPLTVTAKLNYRKFSKEYTDFAFGGHFDRPFSGHFSRDDRNWQYSGVDSTVSAKSIELPDLPVAVMAKQTIVLKYGQSSPTPAAYLRWNDYGIALMREGDLATARNAFDMVTTLESGYADGWVNTARVEIAQGNYGQAQEALGRAESAKPGYYKTRYFEGLIAKLKGEYDVAISSFLSVLESHPLDRVVLNDLGRSYYLNEEFESGLNAFRRVLSIDSEDLTAHYNLMLVYSALEDEQNAAVHRIHYERYKADESAVALARVYRSMHPADNNEASAIHLHR